MRVPLALLLCAWLLSAQLAAPAVIHAVPPAPGCTSPNRVTLTSWFVQLQWFVEGKPTQLHIQVIPFNNDGPGVDLIIARPVSFDGFVVPAPPQWYGLLPAMTYSWRLRASDKTTEARVEDTAWGPRSVPCTFVTPMALSTTISPVFPPFGGTVNSLTPVLQWDNQEREVFYYEVQLSADPEFATDPARARAAVYWNLVHGGVTTPRNSYAVPATSPLAAATKYYWRVRPRVQGDGTPVAWSTTWSFTTP